MMGYFIFFIIKKWIPSTSKQPGVDPAWGQRGLSPLPHASYEAHPMQPPTFFSQGWSRERKKGGRCGRWKTRRINGGAVDPSPNQRFHTPLRARAPELLPRRETKRPASSTSRENRNRPYIDGFFRFANGPWIVEWRQYFFDRIGK